MSISAKENFLTTRNLSNMTNLDHSQLGWYSPKLQLLQLHNKILQKKRISFHSDKTSFFIESLSSLIFVRSNFISTHNCNGELIPQSTYSFAIFQLCLTSPITSLYHFIDSSCNTSGSSSWHLSQINRRLCAIKLHLFVNSYNLVWSD